MSSLTPEGKIKRKVVELLKALRSRLTRPRSQRYCRSSVVKKYNEQVDGGS